MPPICLVLVWLTWNFEKQRLGLLGMILRMAIFIKKRNLAFRFDPIVANLFGINSYYKKEQKLGMPIR